MLHTGFIKDDLLREDVKDELFRNGTKIVDLAFELDYDEGTLYQYLSGRTTSKPIAEKLISYFGYAEGKYSKL